MSAPLAVQVPEPRQAAPRRSRKYLYIAAVILFFAAVVVPAINVNRYKNRVAAAIGQALGRDVTVRSVRLRVLPPGLSLQGLTIGDDPTMSAEPMLRADDVFASLRVSSLWRGRLEISTLQLKYPSLNLVRGPNGRWNLASLLERVRQVPAAPTTNPRPEARARFPYIEATGGRINFKNGPEKRKMALTDADFSFWLASENEWHMRLEARPMRTDQNLSDTGTLKLSGILKRAQALADMPLTLQVSWDRAQLGQLTMLVYGRDRGWRGGVQVDAALQGTVSNLRVTADAKIDDFRRYDIATRDSIHLAAHCTATLITFDRRISDGDCVIPYDGGFLHATGNITGWPATPLSEATVTVSKIPAQSLVLLARQAKRDVPQDLTLTGQIDGTFFYSSDSSADRPHWIGSGTGTGLQLQSTVLSEPLSVERISFSLGQPARAAVNRRPATGAPPNSVRFAPFNVALGGDSPVKIDAWFSPVAYYVGLQGPTALDRLVEIGRTLGLPTTSGKISGNANVNVQLAGEWAGFRAPVLNGHADLDSVRAELPAFNLPLRIASGTVTANERVVSIQNWKASYAGIPGSYSGWIDIPRSCDFSPACAARFNITTDDVDFDDLNRALNPKLRSRPWYALLPVGTAAPPSFWSRLYATGHLSAGKLTLREIVATHAAAEVSVAPRLVKLTGISAAALGGRCSGELTADYRNSSPQYTAQGSLQRLAMKELSSVMHDAWATGSLDLTFQGTASGWSAKDIFSAASATGSFTWHDGALQRVSVDDSGPPLRIRNASGSVIVNNGAISFEDAKLEAPSAVYQVSGTASFSRNLKLMFVPASGNRAYAVTGTLERPRSAVASRSAAQLRSQAKAPRTEVQR